MARIKIRRRRIKISSSSPRGRGEAPARSRSVRRWLTGDEIEDDRRRVVVAECVRYLPDGRSHRSPAAAAVQRALDAVGQEPSRQRRCREGSPDPRRRGAPRVPGSLPGRPSPPRDRPPRPRTEAAARRDRRRRRSREGSQPAAAGCGGRSTGGLATRLPRLSATHGRSRSADRASLVWSTLSSAEQTRGAAKPIGGGWTALDETRRPPSQKPDHHRVRRCGRDAQRVSWSPTTRGHGAARSRRAAVAAHGTAAGGGCWEGGPATRPMAPKDGWSADRGGTAEPLLSDHRPLRTRICWLLDRSNRRPSVAALRVSRCDHQDRVKEPVERHQDFVKVQRRSPGSDLRIAPRTWSRSPAGAGGGRRGRGPPRPGVDIRRSRSEISSRSACGNHSRGPDQRRNDPAGATAEAERARRVRRREQGAARRRRARQRRRRDATRSPAARGRRR